MLPGVLALTRNREPADPSDLKQPVVMPAIGRVPWSLWPFKRWAVLVWLLLGLSAAHPQPLRRQAAPHWRGLAPRAERTGQRRHSRSGPERDRQLPSVLTGR